MLQSDAQNHMSILNMGGIVLGLVTTLVFGLLSDRFHIWKLICVLSLLVALSGLCILQQVWTYKETEITYLFNMS